MFMTLTAIRRPVATAMFFISIGILGAMSYRDLPVELFPDVKTTIVTVRTIYPNAAPGEVERLVTEPIEDAVASISGVDKVTSRTIEGMSNVVIEFVEGSDEATSVSDTRDRVAAIQGQLPDGAEDPIVEKMDFTAEPIMLVGVSADRPSRIIKTVVEDRVKNRLTSVPGVASVSVGGGETREIQISIDQARLKALELSINDVRAQLVSQNLDLPGGRIDEGRREYTVRVLGEFRSIDEIRDVRIDLPNDAGDVGLSEIAEVEDTIADLTSTTRVNGRDSVGISIQKASAANTVKVCESVLERLKELDSQLPSDYEFVVTRDESIFTRDALHDLNFSLYAGVIMAVLVVFSFLRSVRATVIVFFAIPTSMLATFVPLNQIGYTLNFMSMMGLALAVGILVDDSIVVIENIYRHLSLGKPPEQAALDGRMEIGLAAISITSVDVIVFIPIALMKGMMGQFFRPFGLTVAISTLFSLLVSFTLTPMLAARWLRRGGMAEEGQDHVEEALRKRTPYVRALSFAISGWRGWGRVIVPLGGLAVLVLIVAVAGKSLGFEFRPETDQGQIDISVELPTGVRVEETDAVVREIEKRVTGLEEVESYFAQAGRSTTDTGSQYGQITLRLIEKAGWLDRVRHKPGEFVTNKRDERLRIASQNYTIGRLRPLLQDIPGAKIRVGSATEGFSVLEVRLIGRPEDGLLEVHNEVLARLGDVPQITGVSTAWKPGKPEVQAVIDRQKAGAYGFTVAQIASAVRTAVEGDTSTEYRESGVEYDVRIRLRESDRLGPQDMDGIIVGVRNGRAVRLRDVARVESGRGPVRIDHINGEQYIPVTAVWATNPETGKPYASSEGEKAAQAALADIALPSGIRWQLGGEAEFRNESFGYLFEALGLSIILVFILLCALYESCFQPLVIASAMPMALAGGILGLLVADCRLSIMALIGFIMLIGLVTKNGILLVDYANTMRARGMERNEALLRAGPTRLRPILMTTFSLVFALMPIAAAIGKGSELRQPMAAAVVGGMTLATVLTLLVVPALYTLFDDLQERVYAPLKRRLFGE